MSLYTEDPRTYNKTAPRLKEKFLGTVGPLDFSRLSSIRKEIYSINDRKKEIADYINEKLSIMIFSNDIKQLENSIDTRIFRYKNTNLYIHLTENIPRNLVKYGNEQILNTEEIEKIIKSKSSYISKQNYKKL